MDKIYLSSDYNFITKQILLSSHVKDLAFNNKDVYYNDEYQLTLPGPIKLYANYALNDIYINHLFVEKKCLYGSSIKQNEEDLFLIPCLPDKWIESFTQELHIIKILQYNPTKTAKDLSLTSLFVVVHQNLATPFIPPTAASIVYSNNFIEVYEVPLLFSGMELYKLLLQRKFDKIPKHSKVTLTNLCEKYSDLAVLQKLVNEETYVDIPLIGNNSRYLDTTALALTPT